MADPNVSTATDTEPSEDDDAREEGEYVLPPDVNVPEIADALREANAVADEIDEIGFDLRILTLLQVGVSARDGIACNVERRENQATVDTVHTRLGARIRRVYDELGARLDDVQRAVAEHLAKETPQ